MEKMNTIANLLNEKIDRIKELADIVQEIEESEEVYSRACDIRAKITKFGYE
jgi:uncharacterized protein YoxC